MCRKIRACCLKRYSFSDHVQFKWEYFEPETQYMPTNCSTDLQLVVEHIDSVINTGTAAQVSSLQAMFRLEGLKHPKDFAE